MAALSDDQLKAAFVKFDTDGSNYLEHNEMVKVGEFLGFTPEVAEEATRVRRTYVTTLIIYLLILMQTTNY